MSITEIPVESRGGKRRRRRRGKKERREEEGKGGRGRGKMIVNHILGMENF